MITKYYNCEFLTDVVLPASSNTQGNVLLNDFIPGSNFLGVVASSYDTITESFRVFHSGDVCFGDATIAIDKKRSYKTPLSYHELKLGEEIFNKIHLSQEEESSLRQEQKQLKQMRHGYINEEFQVVTPHYNYTQKSSYDKEHRRSKDEGMYGYSALPKGTHWIFSVSYRDASLVDVVEEHLLGNKHLGKSKTSQYGRVLITPLSDLTPPKSFTPNDARTYLYANSRIALIEADGSATTILTIENLGLSSGEIDWEKTFIRTSAYIPYNSKRETKEATRIFIEKGSVITLKGVQEQIVSRVGAFQSEGFGEFLVNPAFLKPKMISLVEPFEEKLQTTTPSQSNELVRFLQNKQSKEQERFDVAQHVQEVYKDLIGPSKAQWGEIRSIASTTNDKEQLIAKISEYISKGVAKKQWETKKGKLLAEIQRSSEPIAFTKLLAMIVAKHTKGGKDAH